MAEDLADLRVRISAESARFDQGLRRSEQAVGRFAGSVESRLGAADTRMKRFSVTASQTSGIFARQFRPAMQQVGFQVGDIATQLSLGTNAMQVFAIQGGQLLSFFGAFGALAGAGLTILGGLAAAMLRGGEEAGTFQEQVEALNKTLADIEGLEKEISNIEDLRDKYGEATQAVIELINVRRRLRREELEQQTRALAGEVRGIIGGDDDTLGNLAARLGLGTGLFGRGVTNELVEVSRALREFQEASQTGSFNDIADAAARLRERLAAAAERVDNMSDEGRELRDTLIEIEETTREAAAQTGEIGRNTGEADKQAGRLERGLGAATDRARDLSGVLSDAAKTLANMAATAQDRLARARIRLEFAGDPVAQARALAEREANQAVADAQRALGTDIPSGFRGALLESVKQDARETVETLTEAARIEQQIRAALTAGGGAATRTASTREIDPLSGLNERIEALRQEAELIGLSEAATVRKTAAIEAERIATEALNKIRAEGREPTPEEIAQVRALADQITRLSVANWSAEEAIRAKAEAAEEARRRNEELARSLSTVADRMIAVVQQADTAKEAIRNLGLEVLRLVTQGLGGQGPLGSVLGNVISSIFSGGSAAPSSSPIPVPRPSARGNVFARGELVPFAQGGIVSRPTIFPMAKGGLGLMGEAGPEAIMPLSRGADGKLGVRGTGGNTYLIDARGADQGAVARLERALQTLAGPGKVERRALSVVQQVWRDNPDAFPQS